jgi:hypothetical protein
MTAIAVAIFIAIPVLLVLLASPILGVDSRDRRGPSRPWQ